jgi:hypothetical protein
MQLPHKRGKTGHMEGISPHITINFAETFYTFRYRVGPSGERVSMLTDFSGSRGEEISLEA